MNSKPALTDQRLARLALDQYHQCPRRVSLLQAERETVWKVQTNAAEPYALHLFGPHGGSRQSLESQCQWLTAISRDTELIVPQPVENRDGKLVTSLAGGSFAMLTRWVPGRRRFRPNGPGVVVLEKVGRLMAQLHLHGRSFKPPPGFDCPRWDWQGLFGKESPWRPRRTLRLDPPTRQLFDQVMRRARQVMKDLGTGADVFGLIHGDLMQANYLVDGRRVHAIDFADFGRGYFLYDMAVTLLMLKPFDRTGRQRAAFVRGYRQVRTLPVKHEALLDSFIAIRAVVLSRWVLGAHRPSDSDRRWVASTLPWVRHRVEKAQR